MFDTPRFSGSPVAWVYRENRKLRLKLDEAEADEFPQLDELRAEGATDYLAFPVVFSNGEVHVGTWATRAAGGFTDEQLAALDRLSAPLSRITEIRALRRTAANLLDTYVGNDAGARILAGQIRLGLTETIHAAIWLSDMRGFTALADSIEPARADRAPQPLLRLPGPGDPAPWRRGAEIHGRRAIGDLSAERGGGPG